MHRTVNITQITYSEQCPLHSTHPTQSTVHITPQCTLYTRCTVYKHCTVQNDASVSSAQMVPLHLCTTHCYASIYWLVCTQHSTTLDSGQTNENIACTTIHLVQLSEEQCSAVQYCAVHCSVMQCMTVIDPIMFTGPGSFYHILPAMPSL